LRIIAPSSHRHAIEHIDRQAMFAHFDALDALRAPALRLLPLDEDHHAASVVKRSGRPSIVGDSTLNEPAV
jgi:hypothetical protein